MDLQAIRADRAALEDELRAAGAIFKGKNCKCPFHSDEHASAGVYLADDGAWKFKCLACGFGGDIFNVRARLKGISVVEAIKDFTADRKPKHQGPPATEKPPRRWTLEQIREDARRAEAIYEYTDPETEQIDLIVVRWRNADGRKWFCPWTWDNDAWIDRQPAGSPRPLYNRTRIRSADRIVVVEGEKCVHALHGVGIVATTSPGGSDRADKADWYPLAGKNVVIWPDFDEPGEKYGRSVVSMLEHLVPAPSVSWLEPTGLGLEPKGDAADYLASMPGEQTRGQREAVERLLTQAVPLGASREVAELVRETGEGKRVAIHWPWGQLHNLTRALIPDTATILCGAGGSSKSFLILQAAQWWHQNGIRVALFELEKTRRFHLMRALAQRIGDSRLTDDEWVRENAAEAEAIVAENQGFLDSFGACIWTTGPEPPTRGQLANWIEQRAAEKAEIIILDPYSVARAEDRVYLADAEFVGRATAILRASQSRLLLVMHPAKGHKGAGLDSVAGGAVFERLTDTVLWLDFHEPPESMTVSVAIGVLDMPVNRTLWVLKARNARGTGMRLAYTFDGRTLTYREHGIIQPKSKGDKRGREANKQFA
ncbi:MAG: hypothetical protein V2A79_14780 [Planctomycetota bacterium]